MIWSVIALGALAVVVVLVSLAVRRGRRGGDAETADVDPLFPGGIALAGAGVALSTALGVGSFALLAIGLAVMAIGAHRTHRHGPRHPD